MNNPRKSERSRFRVWQKLQNAVIIIKKKLTQSLSLVHRSWWGTFAPCQHAPTIKSYWSAFWYLKRFLFWTSPKIFPLQVYNSARVWLEMIKSYLSRGASTNNKYQPARHRFEGARAFRDHWSTWLFTRVFWQVWCHRSSYHRMRGRWIVLMRIKWSNTFSESLILSGCHNRTTKV